MRRVLAVIERDVRKFARNPVIMVMAVVMPILYLVILGPPIESRIGPTRFLVAYLGFAPLFLGLGATMGNAAAAPVRPSSASQVAMFNEGTTDSRRFPMARLIRAASSKCATAAAGSPS